MFPLRDHNPSRSTPWVTWALIAINVIVFLGYLPLMGDPEALQAFFMRWGLVPAWLVNGQASALTLLTSMFLHGGFMHLAGNMLFLWIFADNLEDELGHFGFLLFYLACGVLAALAQVAMAPGSTIPMVGASGAISGVLGGYLVLFPRARVDVLVILGFYVTMIPLPAWLMLGLWFLMQILGGFATPTDAGGVAYWAHAGGFVAGVLLILPTWMRLGARHWWVRTHGHPPHPETRAPGMRIPIVPRRRR